MTPEEHGSRIAGMYASVLGEKLASDVCDEVADAVSEGREQAWIDGNRAAWVGLLNYCLRQLGYESGECSVGRLASEREQAVVKLRRLCAEYGDNDWEPNLHLADIIDKHLGDHLESS